MEGAVLKKRFDDIFDSTRYAKALDEIKVTRKRYQGSVKDLKADLNLLAGHKHGTLYLPCRMTSGLLRCSFHFYCSGSTIICQPFGLCLSNLVICNVILGQCRS